MEKPRNKRTANHGNITYEDSLPFPCIRYPGYFGTFFGFSEHNDSEIYFCACSKTAITHYLQLRHEQNIFRMAMDRIITSYKDFPELVVNEMLTKKAPNDPNIIKWLRFENSLCHKCNHAVPYYNYCHKMYGGIFQQTYGWYINQELFKYGIDPDSFHMAPQHFPQQIVSVFQETSKEYKEEYPQLVMFSSFSIGCSSIEHQKVMKKIRKIGENNVRLELGYKEIGKENVNEKILLNIVQSLFPESKVIHRAKPHFLNGLELDIYLPEENIGIEYQGAQHYRPVKHWGGDKALRNTKSRDSKKKKLCKKHGVNLIYFTCDEVLSRELVKYKLEKISL